MGCGKSSVGRRLSRLLCCPFMDLDQMIEESTGKTIPEIFAESGEAGFRSIEQKALESVLSNHMESNAVLSLGGGTVTKKACADMVKASTTCIYLKASAETLVKHLEGETSQRPMLKGDVRERINELLDARSGIYESTAHFIIEVDGKSIDEVADTITSLI